MPKILLSLFTVGIVSAVAIAGTGAFFSDNEVSENNTISTGTFDLQINENTEGTLFTMDLGELTAMAPGQESEEVSLVIENNGSVNQTWFGYFDTQNVVNNLDEAIYIKSMKMEFLNQAEDTTWEPVDQFITDGVGSGPYPDHYNSLAVSDPLGVISLKTFNSAANNMMGAGNGVFNGSLKPGFKYKLTYVLAFSEDAGNEYFDGSMDLTFKLDATQVNAGAIDNLFAGHPRYSGLGSNLITWNQQQIAKQL